MRISISPGVNRPMRNLECSLATRVFCICICAFAMTAPYPLVAGAPRAPKPASASEIAREAERQLAENYAKDGPGAALIIARGDKVLFRGARGMADVERATPLMPDDLFKIGSITKQFAAAGLLKLVESGKVALNDPLSKFIKDYPDGARITVQQLLNHTSGVKSYTDIRAADDLVPKGTTTAQLIDSFKNAKPDFAPGAGWAYDNSGYVLVGAVIEAASGMAWHAYLQQSLLRPLGLSHTGYDEDPVLASRLVHGYVVSDGKATPAAGLSAVHADGALVSNVDDLLAWNRALHEGRVLRNDSYRKMITPIGEAVPEQYGFALWHTTLRDRDMLGHSGHISGFSAYLLYLPKTRTSVAMLQNMDRAPHVTDPTTSARTLAAFAIGAPYPAAKSIAVDMTALRQGEGIYGIDPAGPSFARVQGARVLRLINGTLTIARTGGERSSLIPIAVDTFRAQDSFDRLQLERDARGAVTALRYFPWSEGAGLVLARARESRSSALRSGDVSQAALERVTGLYAADGMTLHIVLDHGTLKGDIGQPPMITLFAESPTTFLVAEVDATLEMTPVEGKPQLATLHQGNEVVVFKRKP
jgi:D-alanyl-D-alanine carboxypeptidase